MKMNIRNIFSAVAAAAMLTACVGDLNTIPLNPTDVTSETAYGADETGYVQGLAKIYNQLVSNDTKDLEAIRPRRLLSLALFLRTSGIRVPPFLPEERADGMSRFRPCYSQVI